MAARNGNFSTASKNIPRGFAEAVTPHDSTNLDNLTSGLYIGVTGNVTVVMAGDGGVVTFTAVPAGAILPIIVSRVNTTDTTATNIVALSN